VADCSTTTIRSKLKLDTRAHFNTMMMPIIYLKLESPSRCLSLKVLVLSDGFLASLQGGVGSWDLQLRRSPCTWHRLTSDIMRILLGKGKLQIQYQQANIELAYFIPYVDFFIDILSVHSFSYKSHFYRASICEGRLGSSNSVCPSVCHMRGL